MLRRGNEDERTMRTIPHRKVIQATSSITGHHSLLLISSLLFVPSISSLLLSLICATTWYSCYLLLTIRGVVVTVGGRKREKSRIPIGK